MRIYRLSNNFDKEMEQAKKEGFHLIDQKSIGPYTIFLLQSIQNDRNIYQLGLTALDNAFWQPEDQKKQSPQYPVQLSLLKELINAIKDWMKTYPVLFVGSLNSSKTIQYHHIISKFFYTSNIMSDEGVSPKSWYFTIS